METRADLLKEMQLETQFYSRHTIQQYFSHLNDYLDYVGKRDWKDRDILYAYAKKLRAQHSQNHANYIVRGPIGALFRAHGLRLPIKLPKSGVSGLVHDLTAGNAFDAEEINRLIDGAKAIGQPEHMAAICLATIYGPRVSEIAHIKPGDVQPKQHTLVIHTAKHGLKRQHLVPPEIEKYIFGFKYPFASINRLYQVFAEVSAAAGLTRVSRKNFHAIRHGLCTELIHGAKIRSDAVYMFLRWRGSGMLAAYAPFHIDNDQEIFDKHLFLPRWAKGGDVL